MSFKPRIFISSTFDLIKLRKKLSTFFKSIGAEPLLYEENLTPSVNKATYRKDLLDADFTIFIFDKRYGSETDSGLSGTHEEWLISNQNNIPSHVYIKFEDEAKSSKEERLKEFISDEIDNNFVSYYFFKNETDLLRRIKETSLTIAHDIVLNKIEQSSLDKRVVRNLSINQDYKEALSFMRHMEEIIHLHHIEGGPDINRTTILNFILGTWATYADRQRKLFIDEKFNDLFYNIFTPYKKIIDYQLKNLHPSDRDRSVYLKSVGMEVEYEYLHPLNRETVVDWELINDLIQELLDEYVKFKDEIMNKKNQNDIHFNY